MDLNSIKGENFDFDGFFSSKDDLAALMVITPTSEYVVETDVHEEAASDIYMVKIWMMIILLLVSMIRVMFACNL